MAELELDKSERLELRAQAHALQPVVLLGSGGLSEAVFAEIDRALNAHALIKVRIPLDDRNEREAMYAAMADRLSAARIQAIGKLVVLYRPLPETTPEEDEQPKRSRQGKGRTAAKRASLQRR